MPYLLLVSSIWALSFGLIKNQLAGLDASALSVARIALAAAVFLPFARPGRIAAKHAALLALVGAVQFGLMYLFYLRAFQYLQAYEVALFTITTPLFLALLDAAMRRRFEAAHWAAAALSVLGTGVIVWRDTASPRLIAGLVLVQASNACFAAGQLAYRRLRPALAERPDRELFVWLYLGALAITAGASLVSASWARFHPSASQWLVLAYLGVVSSGICFFLWNRGATMVNAGTLAAMNNAKVPLGVACSLLFFHERTDLARLLAGGALLAVSVSLAERSRARAIP